MIIASAVVCAALSGLAVAAARSGLVPSLSVGYSLATIPLLLLVFMAINYVRRWSRPAVPLLTIVVAPTARIENPASSTCIDLPSDATVLARFVRTRQWSPANRFVHLTGETQILVRSHDGREELVLQFIEYKGFPIWTTQERLCIQINEKLLGHVVEQVGAARKKS